MATRQRTKKKDRLVELEQALSKWRASGRPGRKIPRPIWDVAIDLAKQYGVGPVARAVNLDHARLKGLLEAAQNESEALVRAEASPPTFVEFMAAPLHQAVSCVIEVNSIRGGHMRAEISGLDASSISILCREFGNL